jgi:hypothetical protein
MKVEPDDGLGNAVKGWPEVDCLVPLAVTPIVMLNIGKPSRAN